MKPLIQFVSDSEEGHLQVADNGTVWSDMPSCKKAREWRDVVRIFANSIAENRSIASLCIRRYDFIN